MKELNRTPRAAALTAVVVSACLLAGCAGKNRAAKLQENPDALSSEPSLDLAAIHSGKRDPNESIRRLLDEQDESTWQAGAKSKGDKNSIYDSEPLILEDPGAQSRDAAAQARSKRTKAKKPVAAPVEQSANSSGAFVVDAPMLAESSSAAMPILNVTPDSGGPVAETSVRSRETLVAELAASLRDAKQSGVPAQADGLRLLALDRIEPGSVDADLSAFARELSPAETRSFDSLKDLFRTLNVKKGDAGGASASGDDWDPSRLRRVLAEKADSLATGETLAISTAALCTSVDGYGRYTPYESTTFVRGKTQPAILYVSVDHPVQNRVATGTNVAAPAASKSRQSAIEKAKGGPDSADGSSAATLTKDDGVDWAIDLVQSAKLYHDADNLVVLDLGEQTVQDTSRDRRRDICIARRIELPAKLSLGRYNLKVTIRDQASGATAEAIIPIQIVADASLSSR